MPDGSISQEELDSLFGLDEFSIEKPKHVWLVKSGNSVFGFRNYSLLEAQLLRDKVKRENPGIIFEIVQVR